METIKRLVRQYKEKRNLIPYKVVELETKIICEHYRNGNIEVKIK